MIKADLAASRAVPRITKNHHYNANYTLNLSFVERTSVDLLN
jgi:hypothetical protein